MSAGRGKKASSRTAQSSTSTSTVPKTKTGSIDWDKIPLGKVRDRDIAAQYGMPIRTVTQARFRRGIRAEWTKERIDWSKQDLSRPSAEISKELGVTYEAVREAKRRHGFPTKKVFDWDNIPLGKEPDQVIAKRLGCSAKFVCTQRRKRGITRWRPVPVDVTKLPLGKKTDKAIAKSIGVHPTYITKARAKLGIKAFKRPKLGWADKAPLGQLPDRVIAKKFSVSVESVRRARKERGIPPIKRGNDIDWDKQPLGELSDCEIARRLEVSVGWVRNARLKRGINTRAQHRNDVDWLKQPLGYERDSSIGKRLNVDRSVVASVRVARGIPVYPAGMPPVPYGQQAIFIELCERILFVLPSVSRYVNKPESALTSTEVRYKVFPPEVARFRRAAVLEALNWLEKRGSIMRGYVYAKRLYGYINCLEDFREESASL